MFSIPHMIVIFVVVLIVFGPQKLPELARGLGKLLAEFRKASSDFRTAFEQEMRDMERQAMLAERKKQADAAAASAAAEPATLPPPAVERAETSTETPTAASDEARLAEAPVVTTVPESVPRSSEGPETPHSADLTAVPERDSTQDPPSRDLSHDLQRPA